jgi:hypothetical protein
MRAPKLLKYAFKAAKAYRNVKNVVQNPLAYISPKLVKGLVRGAASFLPPSYGFHKKKPGLQYDTHKKVSQYAYVNTANTPKGLKERQKMLDELKSQGYYLDRELSAKEHSVFFNPQTKRVIVGYRGTALDDGSTRLKDLRSDVNILIGKTRNDQRFREADDVFRNVERKYRERAKNKFDIDVTGHSLGGALAKHVNDRHSSIDKNINFSRGSTPFKLQSGKSNQYDVSNVFDPISLGARMEGGNQDKKYAVRDPLGAHNLGYL